MVRILAVGLIRGGTRVSGKDLRRLAFALIIGAALAFPAGVMFGEREPASVKTSGPPASGNRAATNKVRNVYSPTIYDDPYVQDQLRRMIGALEAQCRSQRERCSEARQTRLWMERQTEAK
jgi:hypothetical protein